VAGRPAPTVQERCFSIVCENATTNQAMAGRSRETKSRICGERLAPGMAYRDALLNLVQFSNDKDKLCAQWSKEKCSMAEELIAAIATFGVEVTELLEVCNEAKKDVKHGEVNKFAPSNTSRSYKLNEVGVAAFKEAVARLPKEVAEREPESPPRVRDPGSAAGSNVNSANSSPVKPEAPTRSVRVRPVANAAAGGASIPSAVPPVAVPPIPAAVPLVIPPAVPVAVPGPVIPAFPLGAPVQILLHSTAHALTAVVKTDIRFEPPNGHVLPFNAVEMVQRFKDKVYDVAHRVCDSYTGDPRVCNLTGTAAYELFIVQMAAGVTPAQVRAQVLARWAAQLAAYNPHPGPTPAQQAGCFFFLHLVIAVNGATEITAHRMNMF
jgi:hypothetical protein